MASQSSIESEFHPGLEPSPTPTSVSTTPFSQSWPFDALTAASYSYDTSRMDFTGGVVRLSAIDQLDDGNTCSGFGDGTTPNCGGTFTGVVWDPTNSYLRIGNAGGCNGASGDCGGATGLTATNSPKWSNLKVYFSFDENWYDTVGGITGTVVGNPVATSSSKIGTGAIVFDGSGNVNLTTSSLLKASVFSFSIWVYRQTNTATFHSVFRDEDYNNNMGYYFGDLHSALGDSPYCLRVNGSSGNSYVACEPSATLNQWVHYVGVFDGDHVYLYKNGSLADSANPPFTTVTASPNSTFIGAGFIGRLDELAYWNAALSAADVQSLYRIQTTPTKSGVFTSRVINAFGTTQNWTDLSWVPTLPFSKELTGYSSGALQNETSTDYSSLVGSTGSVGANDLMSGLRLLWHLNETAATSGAANDFADSSGNLLHGEQSGGVTFGQGSNLNKAPVFDGSNDYVTRADSGLLRGMPTLTVAAWVKLAQYPAQTYVPVGHDSATNYRLAISSTGLVTFACATANNGWYTAGTYVTGTTSIPAGQWAHIAGVYDGSRLRVYVNGVLDGVTSTGISGNVKNTSGAFTLGYKSAANIDYYKGSIDEVAVWARVLHPNEILQLYRRGANRASYQIRVCTAADCSDDSEGANWKGPDGTPNSFFSELNNNTAALAMTGSPKTTLPTMLFSDFTSPVGAGRYFQYRILLESDDTSTSCDYGSGGTWCSPEMKSVSVGPNHYDSTSPTVIGKTGVSFVSLSSFAETLGASCASGVTYNLGVGSSYSTATWYYWDGAAWTTADGTVAQSNAASVISTNASTFHGAAGTGTVYFKAFLKSSGTSACELDRLVLDGEG